MPLSEAHARPRRDERRRRLLAVWRDVPDAAFVAFDFCLAADIGYSAAVNWLHEFRALGLLFRFGDFYTNARGRHVRRWAYRLTDAGHAALAAAEGDARDGR